MAPSSAERALRREVARLARLKPHDIAAVLEQVRPAQRRRIAALLGGTPAPDDGGFAALVPQAALSPWLADQMRLSIGRITPAAAAMVEHFLPDVQASARRQPSAMARQTLFGHARSLLTRRGNVA